MFVFLPCKRNKNIKIYDMKKNEEKKVILWVRVSTKEQRTKEQKKETLDLIHKDGYTDDQIIPIEGEGASAIKVDKLYKENMNKLFNHIDNGNIECVYAWSLDRVGRDEKELTFFRWKLEEKHVRFKTVTEGEILSQTSDAMQKFFATFQSLIAADEMRKKKARMMRGVKESKEAGNLTNNPPFGYDKVKNGKRYKAVINEEEAKIIRDIFDMYVNKEMTANAIATKLTTANVFKTNNKNTRCTFIWSILHREKYTGDNVFPPIIDTATFEAAKQRLKESHRQPNYQYDGDFLWFGKNIIYDERGFKVLINNRDACYRTNDKKYGISLNVMDSLLLYVANENQKKYQLDKSQIKEKLTLRISEKETELSNMESEFEDLDKRKKRVKKLYLNGVMNEGEMESETVEIKISEKELNQRKAYLYNTIQELQTEIENLEKPSKYTDIYELPETRQNEIIREIIKKVTLIRVGRSVYNIKFDLFHGYPLTVQCKVMKKEYRIVDGGIAPYTQGMEKLQEYILNNLKKGENLSNILKVPHIQRVPPLRVRLKQAKARTNK